LTATRQVLRAG